jgi:hypothetical protein
MAQYPCDHCGNRYRGPQQTIYPALVNGGFSIREKVRLCPDDFNLAYDWMSNHLVDGNDPAQLGKECGFCAAEDPGVRIFVTVYQTGHDREDFFGLACSDCATKTAAVPLFGRQAGPQASLGRSDH